MLLRRKLLNHCGIAVLANFYPAASLRAGEPDQTSVSQADDQFLEELEKASFLYFWEQASPRTGLVRDRCAVNAASAKANAGKGPEPVASIAATGFGLTALCIGHKRGYVPLRAVGGRVLATLAFLSNKMPTHRGFFYHWANVDTG